MRVVLREATHAHQAVQLAALFVAVHDAQLAHTDRQIFIAVRGKFIYEHTARAVHGFDRAVFAVDLGRVHIFFIVIPVTGSFPQCAREDDGRLHFHIPFAGVDLPPVIDEDIFQHHALGQEERESLALVHHRKDAEFSAQFGMVALFRLFKHGKVGVHLFFFSKRRAVDTGEHLVLFVAAPVRTRDAGEFERFDLARGRQMRPAAKIGKIALFIERDLLAFGQVFDERDLILFRILRHQFDGVRTGQREPLDGQIALDDLFHFRLDLGKVLRGNRRFEVDIVIEPVVDGRADSEFARGEDRLYRLREHVRGGVAVDVEPLFIF